MAGSGRSGCQPARPSDCGRTGHGAGACTRTHILLPSWCAPRRADAIEVIGTALAAAAGGTGHGRIGADLGVPPATVRGCLRRLRSRAGEMRCDAMRQLGAITGHGFAHEDLWPLLGRFGLARHLMPARAG